MSVREIGGVPFQMPERDLPRADASAEAAATAFESYYCEMLIKEMEKTLPKGFLAEGPMEVLSTLVDRALADAMAAGGGMGIGRKLSEQLDAAPTGAMHTAHHSEFSVLLYGYDRRYVYLRLDPEEDFLFFTDRNDGKIYRIRL